MLASSEEMAPSASYKVSTANGLLTLQELEETLSGELRVKQSVGVASVIIIHGLSIEVCR